LEKGEMISCSIYFKRLVLGHSKRMVDQKMPVMAGRLGLPTTHLHSVVFQLTFKFKLQER
jgi:hypothetical protein